MDLEAVLPIKQSEQFAGAHEGDYTNEDGLIMCGRCHKPRQHRIKLYHIDKVVWCMCDCDVVKMEEEKKKREVRDQFEALRRASLMPGVLKSASFQSYTVRSENRNVYNIAIRYVKGFEEVMEPKNQGLLLYGPVGTGKSYTAACIANHLMARGVTVVMTSFVKILSDIADEKVSEKAYTDLIVSPRLLILDDLGAERGTDYALEKVYGIIDSRVRTNKPMILTTNLRAEDMARERDLRYRRIYDRIFQCCYQVPVEGPSFRMVNAAERQEAMARYFGEA